MGIVTVAMLVLVTDIQAGSVSGTVTFKGTPRKAKALQLGADPVCETMHPERLRDEKFTVGEGQGDVYPLADVFVYIKSGVQDKNYPAPTAPVVIDQKGCHYIPHVLGVQVGQEVEFKNSDKTMHNVHSLAKHSSPFNRGMPAGTPNAKYKLKKTEVMAKIKCDAHPWMSCYIGVVPHPFFAVTGIDGKFTLDGLADGEYEVEVWQELLKTQTSKVTVSGGAGTVDFQYVKKKKKKK